MSFFCCLNVLTYFGYFIMIWYLHPFRIFLHDLVLVSMYILYTVKCISKWAICSIWCSLILIAIDINIYTLIFLWSFETYPTFVQMTVTLSYSKFFADNPEFAVCFGKRSFYFDAVVRLGLTFELYKILRRYHILVEQYLHLYACMYQTIVWCIER